MTRQLTRAHGDEIWRHKHWVYRKLRTFVCFEIREAILTFQRQLTWNLREKQLLWERACCIKSSYVQSESVTTFSDKENTNFCYDVKFAWTRHSDITCLFTFCLQCSILYRNGNRLFLRRTCALQRCCVLPSRALFSFNEDQDAVEESETAEWTEFPQNETAARWFQRGSEEQCRHWSDRAKWTRRSQNQGN